VRHSPIWSRLPRVCAPRPVLWPARARGLCSPADLETRSGWGTRRGSLLSFRFADFLAVMEGRLVQLLGLPPLSGGSLVPRTGLWSRRVCHPGLGCCRQSRPDSDSGWIGRCFEFWLALFWPLLIRSHFWDWPDHSCFSWWIPDFSWNWQPG